MRILSFVSLALLAMTISPAATGNRKVTQNALSPSADTSMTLGGRKVTIEYNAPSARGRKVEGELVPHNKVWRLGADSATTLTTDAGIKIGDLSLPKGVYTLYLYNGGGDNGVKLIVNKQIGQWGTEYQDSQDLGRVAMTVTRLTQPVETLKITLKSTSDSAGVLEITWGNSQAVVLVKLG